MKWVEKSSIEKIRRLLEIYERERHYQALLTLENVSAVRNNTTPYKILVIPRPLPSNVVEGEHFVLADVRCLASGGASSSRGLVVEGRLLLQAGVLILLLLVGKLVGVVPSASSLLRR